MTKHQNYQHYKLPITMNPLEYGKLIIKIDDLNLFIVQINKTNIALIQQYEELNHIKFFREGELIFEFKDSKLSENSFSRLIDDQKFTFKNNRLISTEIISVSGNILIYPIYADTNSIQNFNWLK